MSEFKKGCIIKSPQNGLEYEVVKVFPGNFYDLKARKAPYEWMPDFYPVYLSIKVIGFKLVSD
jgi:hypothetical protein